MSSFLPPPPSLPPSSSYTLTLQKHGVVEHDGPIMEVYEDDLIHYIAPLENNDQFYVPEVTMMENDGKKEQ